MIEKLARMPVEVDYGSEFRYRDPLVDEGTLTVVISQSGETPTRWRRSARPSRRDRRRWPSATWSGR